MKKSGLWIAPITTYTRRSGRQQRPTDRYNPRSDWLTSDPLMLTDYTTATLVMEIKLS